MSAYKITIPFCPKSKASVHLGKNHWYNPSRQKMQETREYVKAQYNKEPLSGPLLLIIHYRIPLPAAYRSLRRQKYHNTPHEKKPDRDNLDKFLHDSLKGVLWEDDRQIVWSLISKTNSYSRIGETSIYLEELTSDEKPDYEYLLNVMKREMVLSDEFE